MLSNGFLKLGGSKGWRCDRCGWLITAIHEGWVEWLASENDDGDEVLTGLQLVHRGPIQQNGREQACRYDRLKEFRNAKTIVEGLPLERFVGPDGLMVLLSLLGAGNLPKGQLLELAKRTQIPGYEVARNLLQGISSDLVAPFLGQGYYLQSEIREMIALAMKHG
jgi:hypothetical protein